jgi:hypothetical protein
MARCPPARRCLCALALAALLALPGCGLETATGDDGAHDARTAIAVVDGLPQDGITLGHLDAPATLTVYAAMDDVAAGFFRVELPDLVDHLVRPGRVRIQVRTLAADQATTLGQASKRAGMVAQAVGLQDELWQFYAALGTLSTGSADEATLRRALALTPGLDRGRVLRDARTRRIRSAFDRAARFAREAGIDALPAFTLQVRPGRPQQAIAWNCSGCLTRTVERRLGDH